MYDSNWRCAFYSNVSFIGYWKSFYAYNAERLSENEIENNTR